MEQWRSICLGDPEGKERLLVSQVFWDKEKLNWILVIYSSNGNLLEIGEYEKT